MKTLITLSIFLLCTGVAWSQSESVDWAKAAKAVAQAPWDKVIDFTENETPLTLVVPLSTGADLSRLSSLGNRSVRIVNASEADQSENKEDNCLYLQRVRVNNRNKHVQLVFRYQDYTVKVKLKNEAFYQDKQAWTYYMMIARKDNGRPWMLDLTL
jgi:hypothetical protein